MVDRLVDAAALLEKQIKFKRFSFGWRNKSIAQWLSSINAISMALNADNDRRRLEIFDIKSQSLSFLRRKRLWSIGTFCALTLDIILIIDYDLFTPQKASLKMDRCESLLGGVAQ